MNSEDVMVKLIYTDPCYEQRSVSTSFKWPSLSRIILALLTLDASDDPMTIGKPVDLNLQIELETIFSCDLLVTIEYNHENWLLSGLLSEMVSLSVSFCCSTYNLVFLGIQA